MFVAIARDAVDVAHMTAHDDRSGRRAKSNGYFAAAKNTDGYNAAARGSYQEHAGIRT